MERYESFRNPRNRMSTCYELTVPKRIMHVQHFMDWKEQTCSNTFPRVSRSDSLPANRYCALLCRHFYMYELRLSGHLPPKKYIVIKLKIISNVEFFLKDWKKKKFRVFRSHSMVIIYLSNSLYNNHTMRRVLENVNETGKNTSFLCYSFLRQIFHTN